MERASQRLFAKRMDYIKGRRDCHFALCGTQTAVLCLENLRPKNKNVQCAALGNFVLLHPTRLKIYLF